MKNTTKTIIALILIIFTLYLSGCTAQGDEVIIQREYITNIIGSSAQGSNETLIYANECLDVSCNTFIQVTT